MAPGSPVASVSYAGSAFGPRFRRAVGEELRVALKARGVVLCESPLDLPRDAPIARIRLELVELPRFAVSVDIHDRVTDKRLVREVNLGQFPEDSRALALAVAADELLRASWMELAMEDARDSREAAPAEVRRVVEQEVRRSGDLDTRLGVAFAVEHYTGGLSLLGGELRWRVMLLDVVGIEVRAGARKGLDVRSEHGHIEAWGLGGAAGIPLEIELPFHVVLGLTPLVRLTHVTFEGVPEAGAVGQRASKSTWTACLELSAGYRWEGFDLAVSLGIGRPWVSASALDEDRRAAGLEGLEASAGLLAGWRP